MGLLKEYHIVHGYADRVSQPSSGFADSTTMVGLQVEIHLSRFAD